MFGYNKECRTINGEYVTPLAMEGEFIVCVARGGNTVYKKETDFDMSKPQEKRTITVSPSKKTVVKKEPQVIVEEPVVNITYEEPIKTLKYEPIIERKIEPAPKPAVSQQTKQPQMEIEKDVQRITRKKKIEDKQIEKQTSKDNYSKDEYI